MHQTIPLIFNGAWAIPVIILVNIVLPFCIMAQVLDAQKETYLKTVEKVCDYYKEHTYIHNGEEKVPCYALGTNRWRSYNYS